MSDEAAFGAVLFVLPDFNGGGAERAVLRIVQAWPARLPTPSIAVKATSGPLGDEFRELGIDIVDLGGRTRHSLPSSLRSAVALRRLVAASRPDVVVAVLCGPFVVAACRTLRARPRVAVSVQNPVLTEAAIARRRLLHRWAAARSLRSADVVVPISPGIADELRSLGVRRERITVVPNPVDVAAFRPGAGATRSNTVVVLARLEPQKRVDVALKAFAAAALDGWQLHVYGTGTEMARLQALAASLGLADRVAFAGFTDEPSRALANAGVLLLTSEYEGFGNVLVEALAAGVPVVATDAPFGPRFVLDGGRYGELCPVNDIESLASALRRAAHASDTPEAIAARIARATEFDAARVAPAFAEAVTRR